MVKRTAGAKNWNRKLPRTVRAKASKGRIVDLRTLAEVRDYVAELPAESTQTVAWHRFAERLFDAAAGADPEAVTLHLETLLLHRGLLVLH